MPKYNMQRKTKISEIWTTRNYLNSNKRKITKKMNKHAAQTTKKNVLARMECKVQYTKSESTTLKKT